MRVEIRPKNGIGKRLKPSQIQTLYDGPPTENRLLVLDLKTNKSFLVDTGAQVSVLPRNFAKDNAQSELKLYAANETLISTYGKKQLQLDFGLDRRMKWTFYVADVPNPILGADFIAGQKLLVDLDEILLIDKKSRQSIKGTLGHAPLAGIRIATVTFKPSVANILQEFPEVLGIVKPKAWVKSSVRHHIITTGPPIAEKSRRLSPEKHAATKEELEFLLAQKMIRPSSSPWASPIHLVKKKNGKWRMVGDYRRLNAVTKPDRYAIPHCLDFTNILHGKKFFSTLDLERAYQQI